MVAGQFLAWNAIITWSLRDKTARHTVRKADSTSQRCGVVEDEDDDEYENDS